MKKTQQKWYYNFIWFSLLQILITGVIMPYIDKEPLFQDLGETLLISILGGLIFALIMSWINKRTKE